MLDQVGAAVGDVQREGNPFFDLGLELRIRHVGRLSLESFRVKLAWVLQELRSVINCG